MNQVLTMGIILYLSKYSNWALAFVTGHDFRFRQSRDSNRKSSSKKTSTELTDSGVSVVSDSTPVTSHPSTQCKDKFVTFHLLKLSWFRFFGYWCSWRDSLKKQKYCTFLWNCYRQVWHNCVWLISLSLNVTVKKLASLLHIQGSQFQILASRQPILAGFCCFFLSASLQLLG